MTHDASYKASNSPLADPASFTCSKRVKGRVRGEQGGLFLKLQLATTNFLDTILLECLVSCLIQVNTEDCDTIGNLGLVPASASQVLDDSSPDRIGLGDVFFVGIGDTGEPSVSVLQDLQWISDCVHAVNILDFFLDCK
jgi:hypothetical protein